jgi:ClpP class serine protease
MEQLPTITVSVHGKTDAGHDKPGAVEASVSHRTSAFDLLAATPWAITPEMLETMTAIARRENEPIEAVEARMGRPLQNTRVVSMRGDTAVIPVTGPIFRYGNLFTQISGATSLDVLAQDFNTALENPNVRNIVLNIDSPGGQAPGIADFAAMIRGASKPVTAFIDGMAASAAYWIAAAAREVVISKSAMAGNVGAVLGMNVSKDPNRIEIVSSQSPNKRPDVTNDQGRAQIQTMIDALAQVFIDDVAAFRGKTSESVIADWNGGDMFIGAKAVGLGLADRVGTLEGVLAELASASSPTFQSQKGPAMNIEELRAAHPDVCAALVEEGRSAGFEAGAAAERQRIQEVEAQALPGHEALIQTLKFDGATTGAEAATQVLAAERTLRGKNLAQVHGELPKPVAEAPAPDAEQDPATAKGMPETKEDAQARWDADAAIRSEFKTFGAYWGFCQVERKNKTR